jgi:hypothetical protein
MTSKLKRFCVVILRIGGFGSPRDNLSPVFPPVRIPAWPRFHVVSNTKTPFKPVVTLIAGL